VTTTVDGKWSSFPPELIHLGVASYEDALRLAREDSETFWSTIGQHRLAWQKPFQKAACSDLAAGRVSWYEGGVLNVTESCVDRHLGQNKVALIWEKDEPGSEEYVTYESLHECMCRMANCLRAHGIGKGDRVAIYMPTSPDAVAAILACARIGALHSVVFAGFSADSLASRIESAEAKAVITTDESVRGGKRIPLKTIVDAAVQRCSSVQHVFVARRTGNAILTPGRDVDLAEALTLYSSKCDAVPMDANDLLFLLYTSGSTGKPKGVGHAGAGYLVYASLTHELVFGFQEGDIHGCVADIGWITGHTYVIYGPLSNGATTVLFESVPHYPDPGRYWETVQRLQINQFYTAPTALRMLLKSGDDYVRRYDRSSLKRLGVVGEPLNHEAFHWYRDVVGEGRCDVVDTWWQTETGGIMISPRPSAPGAHIEPAMPMRPFFGVDLILCESEGGKKEIPEDGTAAEGALFIKRAWPGMAKTLWGDHQRFIDTYLTEMPGYFYSGDGARRDEHGHYQITGRLDDVINVSGHRLGTAEIEDIIDEHDDVAEAAVVGYPHAIKGEGIFAFVVLMDGARERRMAKSTSKTELEVENAKAAVEEDVSMELRQSVRRQLAPYAAPDVTLVCPSLPKTRSGKIMRRILRKIAADQLDDLGDVSTLADPSVVDAILEKHISKNPKD